MNHDLAGLTAVLELANIVGNLLTAMAVQLLFQKVSSLH